MQTQKFRTEVVEITPEWAESALALNKNFRNMTPLRYEKYRDEILNGRFKLNGETIKFDDSGRLIDGQNRLKAVVEARQPIKSLVVYGITQDAIPTIDVGQQRSLPQLLKSKNYEHPTILAGALGYVYRFEATGYFKTGDIISREESLDFLKTHPTLIDAVRFTNHTWRLFNRWALHAAVYYTLSVKAGSELADQFYQPLMDGLNITSEENPIYILREKLILEKSVESKMEQNAYAGLIIKAWNLWLTRGTVKQIRYKYHRENIPPIITERRLGESVENYDDENSV